MFRILIADDDPAILKLLTAVLSGDGHAVTAVPDGRQALEALRRQPPDLVVSDIQMPGLNGFELLHEARRGGFSAPFLLISGAATEQNRATARRIGSVGLLGKPLDVARLRQGVADALRAAGGVAAVRPAVLVADDDAAIRRMLETFLGDAGYRVETAANGVEAVERVRRTAEPFLFAFIDETMPELPGHEALGDMVRLRPETLYILATGGGTRQEIRDAFQNGAYTLLRKPFDLEAVLRALPSWEAAAAEHRAKVEQARALDAQPLPRRAARWFRTNVVAPSTVQGRSRVRTALVCVLSAVLAVVALRIATSIHDALQGQQSRLGAFFDRMESFLSRTEGYMERDERRELDGRDGPVKQ